MAFEFRFPDVGEGIHEGRVVEWMVAEGDHVDEDQVLLTVETDKAVVELPSPKSGTVLKLHVSPDATIHVGDVLVSIGEAGEKLAASEPEADRSSATATAEPAEFPEQGSAAPVTPPQRPLATPKTRMLARSLGLDLAQVKGTGRGGRITDEDVERAASGPAPGATREKPASARKVPAAAAERPTPREVASAPVSTAEGPVERVPVSHLRRVIADAMRSSKQTSAHVTHVDEADVTELMAAYDRMKAEIRETTGVRFTLLPFFIKALVAVLKKYPIFNASVDEEAQEIIYKHYYNIGVAVDTPEGLIVPVVKNADQKDMITIAEEIADLAERAKSRTLKLDELRGGSCTITNIGPLGGVFATPIINQPELSIVGLHAIKERPAVVAGEIAIRKQMYLSISFDHRYVDGADAARFMSDYVRLVSNPNMLMVRL